MKYLFILINISFCILISGCKITDPNAGFSKGIPSSYYGEKDSLNVAKINWREYFNTPILIDLIDTALNQNFDILKAFQRIEASRAGVRSSTGALLPTVSGFGTMAQRRYGLYTMDGAGNISTYIRQDEIVPINLRDYYLGLQTSWEADIWGKLRNRRKAAVARFLGSIEAKNLVVTNIIAEVSNSYYELQALDNRLDILRENIKLQEDALMIVQTQKQAGITNELAVKQFEGQVLNSKTMEKETLQEILETENRINYLLGRYPQPVRRNKDQYKDSLDFLVNVGVPTDLLGNRPDIRQSEFELKAAKANVKAAQAAFYPSLNITGAYGYQAFRTSLLFTSPESIAYTIFGGLTAPLLNRSQIKAEFQNANAAQTEALYNYQQSIMNGYIEVYNELARLKRLQEIHDLRTNESLALSQSVDISTELFRSGRATYLEVIISQQKSLDAQLQLVEARKRQNMAKTNLYKALGGGWR
ncbi:MAG: efflux transporter outer membrane subunit [Sporocytophaga sp.]|uniref:efflux transporter outer membrane subunit n=1 Tax=Sporocytophaga sp. TaxID=2231183 RepID=UPI001B243D95|nr:efflux transporter outer membrane subunit [Sporocytophaga sp.]MBO9702741.1 efflux transporter outer membrane subunit [Sporocytophaga sp.]